MEGEKKDDYIIRMCYRKKLFDLDLYPMFLGEENTRKLYEYLETFDWKSLRKRSNLNFGDDGISYTVKVGGFNNRPLKEIVRHVQPWKDFGSNALEEIRDAITELTGARYNYCVIMRYPNSKIGIKKHRDKEMKNGTDIAGVSIGYPRVLRMVPPSYVGVPAENIPLRSGSLYVIKPPTNDHWMHSIEPETSDIKNSVRYSLTFRYT